jgi:alginate O-acetyltransferase complex protein AlgI
VLFNTIDFAWFFAIVFLLALGLSHRRQNLLLLVASYVFYGAWDWRFTGLLALSTVVDFWIARALAVETDARRRRALVSASVAVNLGILGFFKYAGFFAEGLRDLFGLVGVDLPPFVLEVVLPVGISFYTFQTLGYTLDVYRGRVEPARRLLDFALYVAFFPQLVAGPIERANHFLPQVLAPRRIDRERVYSGAWLVLWGLYKKVVIADNLADLVDAVYAAGSSPTGGEVLLAAWVFCWQIYCDFSGYTDVARGVARMLGFDLMVNFRLPFLATSPADHWRRWHISLSTWLRDYLYISLGGNRGGSLRTYRNLMLTMALGGLWHGAAWPFVLWGVFHGAALCIHRALAPLLARVAPRGRAVRALWYLLRVAFTFQIVAFGFLLFRSSSIRQIGELLGALLDGLEPGLAWAWLPTVCALLAPLFLLQAVQAATGDLEPVSRWPAPVRAVTYAVLLAGLLLLGDDGGRAFIYFQF